MHSSAELSKDPHHQGTHVVIDPHHLWVRFFEVLPGALTWLTLIGLAVLSFILPAGVAIFIILYDLYWLIRAVYISAHLVTSYRNLERYRGIDWMERLRMLDNIPTALEEIRNRIRIAKSEMRNGTLSRKDRKGKIRSLWQLQAFQQTLAELHTGQTSILPWRSIRHLVIFPVYKEPIAVLRQSLQALADSDFPLEQVWVVVALEERAGEHADLLRKFVQDEFGSTFGKLLVTFHPDNIPGELKGKSANATWAAKEARKVIDEERIPYEQVIVSNFDADTCVKSDYLPYLTFAYVTTPDRTRCSYQPLPVFHNNIWNAPAFTRVIATNSSFWQMIESTRSYRLITFSSHSMPFAALVDVGYWQTDVVSEDSRIFWQCYLHYNGQYRTIPLFTNVSMDAVEGPTMWQTFVSQYKQKRRWAYGIENFPYMAHGFMHTPGIPLRRRIAFLFRILEGNHSWATSAVIIAGLAWIPVFFGGAAFHMTVLAYSLPRVTRTMMTGAMFGLVIVMTISLYLLPSPPPGTPKRKYVYMILQWALVPVIASVLGSAPAIDAQTRLMLGRPLGFYVTEKVRKEGNV